MPLVNKAAILSLDDISKPVELEVPEWGDTVYLRWPTASERDAWEIYCQEHTSHVKRHDVWRAKLAAMLISDADGKPLFSVSDIEKLGTKSAAALQRIWNRGIKMMQITTDEIKELEKN